MPFLSWLFKSGNQLAIVFIMKEFQQIYKKKSEQKKDSHHKTEKSGFLFNGLCGVLFYADSYWDFKITIIQMIHRQTKSMTINAKLLTILFEGN